MKRSIFFIIVASVFSLAVLPAYADDTSEKKLKIYPSPVERGALLTVEISNGDNKDVTLILYNAVGKVVYTVTTSSPRVEFHAPNISGIYLLRLIENKNVVAIEKIIVKE